VTYSVITAAQLMVAGNPTANNHKEGDTFFEAGAQNVGGLQLAGRVNRDVQCPAFTFHPEIRE